MVKMTCTKRHYQTPFPAMISGPVSHLCRLIVVPVTTLETEAGVDVRTPVGVGCRARSEPEVPVQ